MLVRVAQRFILSRRRYCRSMRMPFGDESGQALVELALALTMYTTIFVGAAEFSRVCFAGIEVANAARAGAEYGAQSRATSSNTTVMSSVALADAANLNGMTATATTLCKCSTGTAITCLNTLACTGRVISYVQVTASDVVDAGFHLPLLPLTYTLTSVAVIRVEQ